MAPAPYPLSVYSYIKSHVLTLVTACVTLCMTFELIQVKPAWDKASKHCSVLKDNHFQFVVYGTSNKWNAYMCSKSTSG